MWLLVSKRSLNISVCEWCIKSACTISGSLLVRILELPNECEPNLKPTSLHQPQNFAVWHFGIYCNLNFRSGNSGIVTNRQTICWCVRAPASLPKACMVVEYASYQDRILQLSHHFLAACVSTWFILNSGVLMECSTAVIRFWIFHGDNVTWWSIKTRWRDNYSLCLLRWGTCRQRPESLAILHHASNIALLEIRYCACLWLQLLLAITSTWLQIIL